VVSLQRRPIERVFEHRIVTLALFSTSPIQL